MKYAVIDISSGGLSYLIASVRNEKTEILLRERLHIGFLSYMAREKLSARGIGKLTDALCEIKRTCEGLGVRRSFLIATALLRHIANREEIENAVTETTGFGVCYLDGETEAYCDFLANRYYAAYPRAILVDMGGKSVEFCDLSKSERADMRSLDFGLFDLVGRFVKKTLPTPEEAKAIKSFLKERYRKEKLPGAERYDTLVTAGASAMAVYAVYAAFTGAEREDGERVIHRKSFSRFVDFLLEGERRSQLILSEAPEKLSLLLPAALFLKTLFKRFDLERAIVSERGVKEGFLRLVFDGKTEGECYDFSKKERIRLSYPAEDEGLKPPVPPSSGRGRRAKKPEEGEGERKEKSSRKKKSA